MAPESSIAIRVDQRMVARHSKCNDLMAALQTNFDMVQNPESLDPTPIADFSPWLAANLPSSSPFDVGDVIYGRDGALSIELRTLGEKALVARWVFQAPLAVRIAGEGSLTDYWRSGFKVANYNLFVARRSQFIAWLDKSSSGVHSADRVTHFAVFSDDVCVEV